MELVPLLGEAGDHGGHGDHGDGCAGANIGGHALVLQADTAQVDGHLLLQAGQAQDHHGDQGHDQVLIVLQVVDHLLEGGVLLHGGLGAAALLDGEQHGDHQHNGHSHEDHTAAEPAQLGTDHGHQQSRQDAAHHGPQLAAGDDAGTLGDVTGHDGGHGEGGSIQDRIGHVEEDIGHQEQHHLGGIAHGLGDGEHCHGGDTDGGSTDPDPGHELLPVLEHMAVNDVAEEHIVHGIPDLGDQQDGSGGSGGEADIRQEGLHIAGEAPKDVLTQEEQAISDALHGGSNEAGFVIQSQFHDFPSFRKKLFYHPAAGAWASRPWPLRHRCISMYRSSIPGPGTLHRRRPWEYGQK